MNIVSTMTHLLTQPQIERARAYVTEHARPLERARLAHVLDGGPVEAVVGELAAYRGEGGGFGHALESDCRAPESSVLATLTALDILRMHAVPAGHELVQHAVSWLVGTVRTDDAGRLVWPFLPPAAQAAPHAPWWDQSEPGQLAETFAGFVANPGLALTAHLFRYAAAAPGSLDPRLLDQLGEQAKEVAAQGLRAEEVNAHDAAAHLVRESAVPADVRGSMAAYLGAVLPERVMGARGEFAAYGIHPLWVAPDPAHPLAEVIAAQVDVALDEVIRGQSADGSWEPFWDWGGWFGAEWAVARREWQGVLIVRNIRALLAWGRLSTARR